MSGSPSAFIVVCATPRSGSYLLCEALRTSGVGGRPEEYLWRPNAERFAEAWGVDVDDTAAFRAAMLDHGTGANGVFACKVMWGYASTAARVMAGEPWGTVDEDGSVDGLDGLALASSDVTFVHMRRRDVGAQAVSHSRAVQQDAWAQLPDGSVVPGDTPVLDDDARVTTMLDAGEELRYDFHHIDYFRQQIEDHNAAWRAWFDFRSIATVDVDYEDLVADYEGTALRVLNAAGVDTGGATFGERRMQRQRDHVSRRWLLRYREDLLAMHIAERLEAGVAS